MPPCPIRFGSRYRGGRIFVWTCTPESGFPLLRGEVTGMTRANRSASLGRGASRARHHRGSPSVRRTLAAAILALAAPTAASARLDGAGARPATQAAARTPTPLFAVSGRGWGHGVGMSQYGAL